MLPSSAAPPHKSPVRTQICTCHLLVNSPAKLGGSFIQREMKTTIWYFQIHLRLSRNSQSLPPFFSIVHFGVHFVTLSLGITEFSDKDDP